MADLLWSDISEVTREQAKQDLLVLLEDVGYPATSWQDFSLAALAVEIGAEIQAQGSRTTVAYKNAFQAETATGEALTRTSRGFYDNTRNGAQKTQLLVTLACDAAEGPHTLNLGEMVFSHEQGATYRNNTAGETVYPFSLNSGATHTFLADAEVAGAKANIANALTPDLVKLSLVTTLAGVTITAYEIETAGYDEEDDRRLRARDQLKWTLITKGDGIDDTYAALTLEASPTIVHVSVDSTNPRGAGTFDVYIAGLDATASADDVGKAQALLRKHVFGGDATVKAKASPTVDVVISGVVYHSGNYAAADVQAVVEAALLDFIRSTPSGGWDFSPGPSGIIALNDLEAVIKGVRIGDALPVKTVKLTTPIADLPIPQFGRPIFVQPTLTYQPTAKG
jgi:uncharacterized phage protein gp47/JayE